MAWMRLRLRLRLRRLRWLRLLRWLRWLRWPSRLRWLRGGQGVTIAAPCEAADGGGHQRLKYAVH
jgi:hypothetical protein